MVKFITLGLPPRPPEGSLLICSHGQKSSKLKIIKIPKKGVDQKFDDWLSKVKEIVRQKIKSPDFRQLSQRGHQRPLWLSYRLIFNTIAKRKSIEFNDVKASARENLMLCRCSKLDEGFLHAWLNLFQ